MDADQLKRLTAPFPKEALKTREGGRGKQLTYVAGHTVIHRLNDVTDNNWNLEILSVTSDQITAYGKPAEQVRAHVRLTIPNLGSREHVGVQILSAGSGEDLYKGAITDALKKAATLFGVGLELYGEDYEDENYAPAQARQMPRPAPTPAARPIAPQSAPQAPQRPANVTPLPKPAEETRESVGRWAKTQGIGLPDILRALDAESIDGWFEAHPNAQWADLKQVVIDAIFPAPAEASS